MSMEARSGRVDLRGYLDVLWYRKWSVLAIVAVVLGTTLFFTSRQTPIYTSNAAVLVKPLVNVGVQSPNTFQPLNLDTESRIAASPEVAELAGQTLGMSDATTLLGGLEVTVDPGTEILSFSYSNLSRTIARARTQAFADAYIAFREDQAQNRLDMAAQAADAESQSLDDRIQKLRNQLAKTRDSAKRSSLQVEINSLVGRQAVLQSQVVQAYAAGSLDVGQVVQPATSPSRPSSPSYPRNSGVAIIGGLLLGIGATFLRERIDPRVRGRSELERHAGTPVLAVIPRMGMWRRRRQPLLVSATHPHSIGAESYRTLRTGVLFAASQQNMHLLLVTSAQAAEGKTSTVANLGLALAQAGKKVVMVDADLRNPRLAEFFGNEPRSGLSLILAGTTNLPDAVVNTREYNLKLLPSGPIPPNPAELLSSERMGKVVDELRDSADVVLLDSAPVLGTADAMILAPLVDGVLFVADAGRTTPEMVEGACEQLLQVQAPLFGAVLNNVETARARVYRPTHTPHGPSAAIEEWRARVIKHRRAQR